MVGFVARTLLYGFAGKALSKAVVSGAKSASAIALKTFQAARYAGTEAAKYIASRRAELIRISRTGAATLDVLRKSRQLGSQFYTELRNKVSREADLRVELAFRRMRERYNEALGRIAESTGLTKLGKKILKSQIAGEVTFLPMTYLFYQMDKNAGNIDPETSFGEYYLRGVLPVSLAVGVGISHGTRLGKQMARAIFRKRPASQGLFTMVEAGLTGVTAINRPASILVGAAQHFIARYIHASEKLKVNPEGTIRALKNITEETSKVLAFKNIGYSDYAAFQSTLVGIHDGTLLARLVKWYSELIREGPVLRRANRFLKRSLRRSGRVFGKEEIIGLERITDESLLQDYNFPIANKTAAKHLKDGTAEGSMRVSVVSDRRRITFLGQTYDIGLLHIDSLRDTASFLATVGFSIANRRWFNFFDQGLNLLRSATTKALTTEREKAYVPIGIGHKAEKTINVGFTPHNVNEIVDYLNKGQFEQAAMAAVLGMTSIGRSVLGTRLKDGKEIWKLSDIEEALAKKRSESGLTASARKTLLETYKTLRSFVHARTEEAAAYLGLRTNSKDLDDKTVQITKRVQAYMATNALRGLWALSTGETFIRTGNLGIILRPDKHSFYEFAYRGKPVEYSYLVHGDTRIGALANLLFGEPKEYMFTGLNEVVKDPSISPLQLRRSTAYQKLGGFRKFAAKFLDTLEVGMGYDTPVYTLVSSIFKKYADHSYPGNLVLAVAKNEITVEDLKAIFDLPSTATVSNEDKRKVVDSARMISERIVDTLLKSVSTLTAINRNAEGTLGYGHFIKSLLEIARELDIKDQFLMEFHGAIVPQSHNPYSIPYYGTPAWIIKSYVSLLEKTMRETGTTVVSKRTLYSPLREMLENNNINPIAETTAPIPRSGYAPIDRLHNELIDYMLEKIGMTLAGRQKPEVEAVSKLEQLLSTYMTAGAKYASGRKTYSITSGTGILNAIKMRALTNKYMNPNAAALEDHEKATLVDHIVSVSKLLFPKFTSLSELLSVRNSNPFLREPTSLANNIVLIPRPLDRIIGQHHISAIVGDQKVTIRTVPLNLPELGVMAAVNTMNSALSILGLGFDVAETTNVRTIVTKSLTKRVMPLMGIIAIDELVRTVAQATPFLNQTSLVSGLTGIAMDAYAGFRIASQTLLDITGVTEQARYLEELMPGSIDSPASAFLRSVLPVAFGLKIGSIGRAGPMRGGLIGGAIGVILGGGPLALFDNWNISKSRDELIAEFSGEKEIAIKKGRFWELCLTENNLVITSSGVKKIKNIMLGDTVYNYRAQEATVNGFSSRLDTKVYKVKHAGFTDTAIEATAEHPILVFKDHKHEWTMVSQIREGDWLYFPIPKNLPEEDSGVSLWLCKLSQGIKCQLVRLPDGNLTVKELDASFRGIKFLSKECVLFRVEEVTMEESLTEPFRVYDIFVPKGNSFLGIGVTYHNSGTPLEGSGISYFRPHQYVIQRSSYEWASNYFGGGYIDRLVSYLDPGNFARKHYYSRPYLQDPGPFTSLPLVGPLIAGFNRAMGIAKPLHQDFVAEYAKTSILHNTALEDITTETKASEILQSSIQTYATNKVNTILGRLQETDELLSSYTDNQFFSLGYWYGSTPVRHRISQIDIYTREAGEFGTVVNETLDNLMNIAGLRGFIAGQMVASITGTPTIFDRGYEWENPAETVSLTRSFWDKELGGLLGLTEGIRRIFANPYTGDVQKVSIVPNTMPLWLPGADSFTDFLVGDPYIKVKYGELRLPGKAYEVTHNVFYTYPIDAMVIGKPLEEQLAFYAGDELYLAKLRRVWHHVERTRKEIIGRLKKYVLVRKEADVAYDAANDVFAFVDAIVEDKTLGKVALLIAPEYTTEEGTSAKEASAISQLNTYLVNNQKGITEGILIWLDKDGNITKQLVRRDLKRYERDLARAREAIRLAKEMTVEIEKKGIPVNRWTAYSHVDRLKILMDVAPFSKEAQLQFKIVKQQAKYGTLSPEEHKKFRSVLSQLASKFQSIESEEYRFIPYLMKYTPLGKQAIERMKEMEEAEYTPLELYVGAVWEFLTHSSIPGTYKLMSTRSAIERYEKDVAIGKGFRKWEEPISDFLLPGIEYTFHSDYPHERFLRGVFTGYIVGGPIGASVLPVVAALGGGESRRSSRLSEIDRLALIGEVLEAAEVEAFEKTNQAKDRSVSLRSKTNAYNYLSDVLGRDATFTVVLGGLTPAERPYVRRILLNMYAEDIPRLERLLPSYAAYAFKSYTTGERPILDEDFRAELAEIRRVVDGMPLTFTTEDIIYKLAATRGIEAREMGLGWKQQINRVRNLEQAYGEINTSSLEQLFVK